MIIKTEKYASEIIVAYVKKGDIKYVKSGHSSFFRKSDAFQTVFENHV